MNTSVTNCLRVHWHFAEEGVCSGNANHSNNDRRLLGTLQDWGSPQQAQWPPALWRGQEAQGACQWLLPGILGSPPPALAHQGKNEFPPGHVVASRDSGAMRTRFCFSCHLISFCSYNSVCARHAQSTFEHCIKFANKNYYRFQKQQMSFKWITL